MSLVIQRTVSRYEKIPNNLLRLQKYGLQIKLVDGDLRSHKNITMLLRNLVVI